jgi:Skp family chaperone for outer membrane proteins
MIALAKMFFGGFIKDNLKIVLIALVVLIATATAFAYKVAYDNTKQEYAQHLINDAVAEKLDKKKAKIVEESARKSTALEIAKHKKVIAALQVNEIDLKKKVGNLYANKTNADFRLASYADRMLLEAGSRNTTGEIASDTERLASCRRELDATDTGLSIVEEACAVTTAQFNLARGWIDSVCAYNDCTLKQD